MSLFMSFQLMFQSWWVSGLFDQAPSAHHWTQILCRWTWCLGSHLLADVQFTLRQLRDPWDVFAFGRVLLEPQGITAVGNSKSEVCRALSWVNFSQVWSNWTFEIQPGIWPESPWRPAEARHSARFSPAIYTLSLGCLFSKKQVWAKQSP